MSKWWEVENLECFSVSDDREEVHICFDQDYQGALYISIPTELLISFLRTSGLVVEILEAEEEDDE